MRFRKSGKRKRRDRLRPEPGTSDDKLSWANNPTRELVRLSWPIAVSMVSYATMTLVDTLFVSRLGGSALAGVGLGGTAAFALLCFTFGLMRGVKTRVSQAVGAGRRTEVDAYLGAGLLLAVSLGALVLGLGQLVARTLPDIAASGESGAHAQTYMSIRMLAAPIALTFVALREHRLGLGDARTPMIASVVANIVNIGLDALFIVVLDWGVPGAAFATIIGQSSQAVLLGLVQYLEKPRLSQTRLRHIRSISKVGMPIAIQFQLEMGSFALLAAMLAALSDVEMAAHQIALQVIHFTFLPMLAVAEAGAVLSGQAVGADRDAMVPRVVKAGMKVSSGYALFCTLVLAVGAPIIVTGFTDDPVLAQSAIELLWCAAVFQWFDAAYSIFRGALRGAGDVKFSATVGVILAWVLTPPLTYLLGYRAGLGALGGWIGITAEIVIGAAIMGVRLSRGGWLPFAKESRAEIEADSDEIELAPVAAE